MRLLSLCSHWEQASLGEQLEFLSYLFQNALPQCLPESLSVYGNSISGHIGTNHIISECIREQSGQVMSSRSSDEPLLNAGKGSRWETEEVELILKLRDEQGLAWFDNAKAFEEKWPGRRSQSSIQVIELNIKKKPR
jgi:hypothetical protein